MQRRVLRSDQGSLREASELRLHVLQVLTELVFLAFGSSIGCRLGTKAEDLSAKQLTLGLEETQLLLALLRLSLGLLLFPLQLRGSLVELMEVGLSFLQAQAGIVLILRSVPWA